MSAIDPIFSGYSADALGATENRIPSKTLSQDDFLQLLIKELTTQDPLDPTSNTDFLSQMATYNSLSQNSSLEDSMQFLKANSLLGRTVELDGNGYNDEPVTGLVTAVQVKAGTPQIVVGDQAYDLDRVLAVTEKYTQNQPETL